MKAEFDPRELALAIQEAQVTMVRSRKAPKVAMTVKKTKTFLKGTDGDSNGYPKLNYFEKFNAHKSLGHF